MWTEIQETLARILEVALERDAGLAARLAEVRELKNSTKVFRDSADK